MISSILSLGQEFRAALCKAAAISSFLTRTLIWAAERCLRSCVFPVETSSGLVIFAVWGELLGGGYFKSLPISVTHVGHRFGGAKLDTGTGQCAPRCCREFGSKHSELGPTQPLCFRSRPRLEKPALRKHRLPMFFCLRHI